MFDSIPCPIIIVSEVEQQVLYANAPAEALQPAQLVPKLSPTLEPLLLPPHWWQVQRQAMTYQGQPAHLLMFHDITAYKQDIEHYKLLTEFISDYTFSYRVEPDGRLVREWLSEAFTAITGFTPQEIDPLTQMNEFMHPGDVDVVKQQIQAVLDGQRDVREFRFLNKNGDLSWLRQYLSPVKRLPETRVTHIYGMGEDVTYRKRAEEALLYGTAQDIAYRKHAEEQLRRYARELESINQELDAYSHTIAHDLKAPLSGVMGFIDLLEYTVEYAFDKEKTLQFAKRIRESAGQMSNMIYQLLMMARLRNAEASVVAVNIKDTLDQVMLRLQQLIERHHITLEIVDPLPPVLGHAPWLEEVFANLLSNAIKYIGDENPAPKIIIRAKLLPDNRIRYEVEDNGVGIREADQAKLFQMFSRVEGTAKKEGTGLGLSIVQRIITKLKGELGVTSELGKGSTFWFILPSA